MEDMIYLFVNIGAHFIYAAKLYAASFTLMGTSSCWKKCLHLVVSADKVMHLERITYDNQMHECAV